MLMLAALNGLTEIARQLIEKGADVNATNGEGAFETPIGSYKTL